MRAVGIGIVAVASFGLGYGVGYDEGFEARDTFPTAIECTWPDGTKERAREVISHGEDGTDVRCVSTPPPERAPLRPEDRFSWDRMRIAVTDE